MSKSGSPAMNKKKLYCEEERCHNEEEKKKKDRVNKKSFAAKMTEVVAKKRMLDGGVHGGPHQIHPSRISYVKHDLLVDSVTLVAYYT